MPNPYAEFYSENAADNVRDQVHAVEKEGQIVIGSPHGPLIWLDPYSARLLADEIHCAVDVYEAS
jgi:hypothetical protein